MAYKDVIFYGEVPKIHSDVLKDGYALHAENVNLHHGDLRPYPCPVIYCSHDDSIPAPPSVPPIQPPPPEVIPPSPQPPPPDNPEVPVDPDPPSFLVGLSDPYAMGDSSRNKRIIAINENASRGLNTMHLRLLVWAEVDYLEGKQFNLFNDWQDSTSGFNQAWWDELEWYVGTMNTNGIQPVIYPFDFWATYRMAEGSLPFLGQHDDPFTYVNPNAYQGALTTEQVAYLEKMIAVLAPYGIRAWNEGNEGRNFAGTFPPSLVWRQSYLDFMSARVSEPIGCYDDNATVQPGFDWADQHGDALNDPTPTNAWITESGSPIGGCTGPLWSDCWGGGAPQQYYEDLIQKCIGLNAPYLDSFWQWDKMPFAQRQLAAIDAVLP